VSHWRPSDKRQKAFSWGNAKVKTQMVNTILVSSVKQNNPEKETPNGKTDVEIEQWITDMNIGKGVHVYINIYRWR